MRIEFLRAGTGDCIWISNNKKNVVIDGGKTASAIIERYVQLPRDENVDLLIVTHIDSDHITGVIALVELMMKQDEADRLKQIWFNFPKKEESDEYSVAEGNALSTLLLKVKDLAWCNNTSELIGNPVVVGDMKLYVLAQDYDVSEEYRPKEPAELGVENADWDVGLETLVGNVDDDDLDEGGPNSQSIVILVECGDKKVLLPGDCTPVELHKALQEYNAVYGMPMYVDLMKLPHHGSRRNITKDILEEMECSDFVISTNVNRKYCFPHKETVAKLICYRHNIDEPVNVFFNYQEVLDVLGITEEDQAKYNLRLFDSREFNF